MSPYDLMAVERGQLAALATIARRLHTEQRLTGDEMRDMGHTIVAIVDHAIEVPPEVTPCDRTPRT